jgi:hypothetical protein
MSPAQECRRHYAQLRDAYARAIAEGNPIRAGNLARKMAQVRKAAWSVKVLENRARACL